jgi:hypothetical protein
MTIACDFDEIAFRHFPARDGPHLQLLPLPSCKTLVLAHQCIGFFLQFFKIIEGELLRRFRGQHPALELIYDSVRSARRGAAYFGTGREIGLAWRRSCHANLG